MTLVRFTTIAPLLVAAGIAPLAPAEAQNSRWFVRAGPGVVAPHEKARVAVARTTVPGAAIAMKDRLAGAIEVGRFVTPALAVAISAGLPVKQPIVGAGTIAPYGRLGRITYGPAAATIQWHPLRAAPVHPYLGAGVAYLHVFDNKGVALQDLHVDDDLGPVFQAGFEVPVRAGIGLFVDAKKALLRTDATGSLGAAPVAARIRVDPLVVTAGLTIGF